MSFICDDCGSDRISIDTLPDLLLLAENCDALLVEDEDDCEVVFHGAALRAFARAIKEGKT